MKFSCNTRKAIRDRAGACGFTGACQCLPVVFALIQNLLKQPEVVVVIAGQCYLISGQQIGKGGVREGDFVVSPVDQQVVYSCQIGSRQNVIRFRLQSCC